MHNRSLSGCFSMAKAAYNRLLSLSDIQLGPQKLNFAVTKIVTVLIFGIFCPRTPKEPPTDSLRKLKQLGQLVDNLVRGILAKAKALLALGNNCQAGSLASGDARHRILNAAAAIRGQPQ